MVNKYLPDSKLEALELLSQKPLYIVAGGSDLMVMKKNVAGLAPNFDHDILYISNIKDLKNIYRDEEGIHIGAGMTMDEVEHHELCPVLLRKALKEVASSNIRHFATLAGNIANASPAGDTPVVDVVLDAIIKLESKRGTRFIKAEDFILGVRKIACEDDELITEIIFPNNDFTGNSWLKVGSRKADSIAKVSVACAYKIENRRVESFALAFGSVAAKVIRCHDIEKKIIGLTLSELKLRKEDIVENYGKSISPINDQRSTSEYRMTVAKNIVRKFIDEICLGGQQ